MRPANTALSVVKYESCVSDINTLQEREKKRRRKNIYIHYRWWNGLEDHAVPRHESTGTHSGREFKSEACPLRWDEKRSWTSCLNSDQGNWIQRVRICVLVLHYFWPRKWRREGLEQKWLILPPAAGCCSLYVKTWNVHVMMWYFHEITW